MESIARLARIANFSIPDASICIINDSCMYCQTFIGVQRNSTHCVCALNICRGGENYSNVTSVWSDAAIILCVNQTLCLNGQVISLSSKILQFKWQYFEIFVIKPNTSKDVFVSCLLRELLAKPLSHQYILAMKYSNCSKKYVIFRKSRDFSVITETMLTYEKLYFQLFPFNGPVTFR